MNIDQIFEEIQNDYLYIQEEYQELDNLINKYNNLNYAFEEVSVQLEAINKFGLSDETNYFINNAMKNISGARMPRITTKYIKNEVKIPLPSLQEQKRIVAILDEAFAGISLAVANAEKNLANARELFESYLNNVFTQKGDGWEEKNLEDIADFKNGS